MSTFPCHPIRTARMPARAKARGSSTIFDISPLPDRSQLAYLLGRTSQEWQVVASRNERYNLA